MQFLKMIQLPFIITTRLLKKTNNHFESFKLSTHFNLEFAQKFALHFEIPLCFLLPRALSITYLTYCLLFDSVC